MNERVYIIAEAGVNHNGDLGRALAMVDAAAMAGSDAVKFQTFHPEALVTANAPQAPYQIRNDGDQGSQLTMLQRLVLGPSEHLALMARCAQQGIDFLSSPFDPASADFLIHELRLPRVKLGSGELTNGPLLLQLARADRDLILSTGMATLLRSARRWGCWPSATCGKASRPTGRICWTHWSTRGSARC
jgi:sialic acid synthase SpsE